MAGVPINFAVPSEALVSYSYLDLFSKTGWLTFYGQHCDAGKFLNVTNTIESGSQSFAVANNTTYTFDFLFNVPQTTKAGYAFLATLFGVANTGKYITVVASLFHVDAAATETQIGSDTTIGTVNSGGVTWVGGRKSNAIPLTSKHFKIGETLRLKLLVTTNGSSPGIVCDPTNSSYTIDSVTYSKTNMLLNIPFKLDL